jgi:large subunit ribosomal protein L19
MKSQEIIDLVEKANIKVDLTAFDIGDTVNVHLKIVEGEKERTQIFTGVVISKKGSGTNSSFTVRRLVGSEGVERVFPVNCPSISKIVVKKKGKVRRAKLYYLRNRVGKATRIAEKIGPVGGASNDDRPPIEEAVKPRQKQEEPEKKAEEAEQEEEKQDEAQDAKE